VGAQTVGVGAGGSILMRNHCESEVQKGSAVEGTSLWSGYVGRAERLAWVRARMMKFFPAEVGGR
jgi:hypothetical protein